MSSRAYLPPGVPISLLEPPRLLPPWVPDGEPLRIELPLAAYRVTVRIETPEGRTAQAQMLLSPDSAWRYGTYAARRLTDEVGHLLGWLTDTSPGENEALRRRLERVEKLCDDGSFLLRIVDVREALA